MNGNADMGKGTQGLAPFIAMLLSLADHAARVSQRSVFLRIFVLWTLRRSEAEMRNWFVGAAGMCSPRTARRLGEGTPTRGYSANDALRLAALFRAMAKALMRLEARYRRGERRLARRAQDMVSESEIVLGQAHWGPEFLVPPGSPALVSALAFERLIGAAPALVIAPDTS